MNQTSHLTFKAFLSREIENVLDGLSSLRITVFRDFPYLYEGSRDYEKKYLNRYIEARSSALFCIFDKSDLVGASTVLKLSEEDSAIQSPFAKNGNDLNAIYYFGESLLLKPYRGLGLGHYFFDAREDFAKKDKSCKLTTFCAVERQVGHPLRPPDYVPLNAFWQKRGYQKNESLFTELNWLDLNEQTETNKKMIFWTKKINEPV